MDYDRYDALLHHIFKQTQEDAWFRPHESTISGGVALRTRVEPVEYRVFPYETASLLPFEAAVKSLNPVVAVKVRSAAVHAALATCSADTESILVDSSTRIQVLPSMSYLSNADKAQRAAFIRDERVAVVWSEELDGVIPLVQDLEERLLKFLWRSRPAESVTPSTPSIASSTNKSASRETKELTTDTKYSEEEEYVPEPRLPKLYAPVYNGIAMGLAFIFIANGTRILLQESLLDHTYMRFILVVTLPMLFCVSLFFTIQLVQNITMSIGPIAHYHSNSAYYSGAAPKPCEVDSCLPHITIQLPVYKESLHAVLMPSIVSLKKAMQTYARQGGSSSIFVNDDGLRLLSRADRDERLAYYAEHDIAWVARPRQGCPAYGYAVDPDEAEKGKKSTKEVFDRPGRFKKASNMNYALNLSLEMERHLLAGAPVDVTNQRLHGLEYSNKDGDDMSINMLSDTNSPSALQMAIRALSRDSKFTPWAANPRNMRIGEIILLVDSDTVVPADCLRDAAREMYQCPSVAIIQHDSGVLQVAHHYFENSIAYFTRRINRCISMACANGEVAPFVGHNAFLRWKAVQDAAISKDGGIGSIWSESNVSEDFDLALRLIRKGYTVRWATYSHGEFKEGVSLTISDELSRWQKYAYGVSELLFNPVLQWGRMGPIGKQIHRFMWCGAPLHYKVSVMAYTFSYYGIAAALPIAIINYVLLGFMLPVDNFYMHSFEIWLATTVVFFGAGNIGYTLLEYRLGVDVYEGKSKGLFKHLFTNILYIPFFFIFFGGLSLPLSYALLAHLFSLPMTWTTTAKEVTRSNFFLEIPAIIKRFGWYMLISFMCAIGMIISSVIDKIVGAEKGEGWRVGGDSWAVIFSLAVVSGCHILFPLVLNPWLMVFSY